MMTNGTRATRWRVTPAWLALGWFVACSNASAPAAAPVQGASSESAPAPAVSTPAAPPAGAASPPAAPSPEDAKREQDQRQLAADWSKLDAEDATEVQRLTPDLHAQTRALVEKKQPGLHAALTAALASKHRKPPNPARDPYRHPLETLEFFGLTQEQTVLEYGPGDGWFTELLAPVLAARGKLIVTATDPKGPRDQRATYYGERTRRFLARLPEAYAKVETVLLDPKAPRLGPDASIDLLLFSRGAHNLVTDGKLALYLGEFWRVLKPGGILAVEQHRADAGADPTASAKRGYLPEKWLIASIESAGFKLAGRAEINANPKDTKDYPEGVWTLPPALRLGDQDRAKYLAIGESDRMTLRFVKAPQR